MAKVYLICGRVCSGKSTYAMQLVQKHRAVLLSSDEMTLALFGQHCGEKHDEYVERAQRYLFDKSLEILAQDIPVVLDWGFWMKEERDEARAFYGEKGIAYEFHYIDVTDEEWHRRLIKRNADVLKGDVSAYYIDENIAKKFGAIFEKPAPEEMDIWVQA